MNHFKCEKGVRSFLLGLQMARIKKLRTRFTAAFIASPLHEGMYIAFATRLDVLRNWSIKTWLSD